jgi:hypothetical protein
MFLCRLEPGHELLIFLFSVTASSLLFKGNGVSSGLKRPGREIKHWSPSSANVKNEWQRPPPDKTQYSQETDIRTLNPSRRSVADLRFRPLVHWERLDVFFYDITFGTVARLSVWATEEIWIDSRQGQQMFLFSETSGPVLGPSKLHI